MRPRKYITYEDRQKVEEYLVSKQRRYVFNTDLENLSTSMGFSKNTIPFEIKKNGGMREYTADKGQAALEQSRVNRRKKVSASHVTRRRLLQEVKELKQLQSTNPQLEQQTQSCSTEIEQIKTQINNMKEQIDIMFDIIKEMKR